MRTVPLGRREPVVPVEHEMLAHGAMPRSRLEIFEGAGHFPFHRQSAGVLRAIRAFLADTEPARWNVDAWRALLGTGARTGRGRLGP